MKWKDASVGAVYVELLMLDTVAMAVTWGLGWVALAKLDLHRPSHDIAELSTEENLYCVTHLLEERVNWSVSTLPAHWRCLLTVCV